MADSPYEPEKIFTVEEANATLPLVRVIVRDLADLSREVIERRERVALLRGNRDRDPESDDPYSEELAQIEEELDKDGRRLQEYVEELRQLGVEPKNSVEGIVDFPAMLDDGLAFLCWKLDEPELLFWHELDAGFQGRQPLTAASLADEGSEPNQTSPEGG